MYFNIYLQSIPFLSLLVTMVLYYWNERQWNLFTYIN